MMQLLEKLPGITVERYTLMERSYTFHAGDSNKRPVPPQQAKHKLRVNSATRGKLREDRRQIDVEVPGRMKQTPGYSQRPVSNTKRRTEFEVYGNKLHQPGRVKDENDNYKPELQMPKSILKRPGSGVSVRSNRSIGVLSLDSGMAKLAASLFRKNNDVNKPDDVTDHVIKANERQARASKGNFPDSPNLPTLANKSNGKPPSGYSPRPIAASPSKSVSFKLEPEHKDANMTKRGGARWGVAFSSNQDRKTYNTADRVFQPSDGRASRTLDRKLHYGQHKLERAPIESHPSTALLRPRADGGITGISGIHLMADPYRRYLMARAVDQSEKYREKTKTGEEHGRKSLQSDINSNSHFGGDSRFGNRRNFHQALPSLKQGR